MIQWYQKDCFIMALDVKLLEIPYESLGTDKDGNYDKSLPLVAGKSKFINIADRIIIVTDICGYIMPFYLSSGHGGKVNVPAGKWYPFFGINFDDLWINKMDSETISEYYHSDILKKICHQLDQTVGDIRKNTATIPTTSLKSRRAIDFINQSFPQTTPNNTVNTKKIVSQNVAAATIALDNIYRRAMRDATGKISTPTIYNNRFQKQND